MINTLHYSIIRNELSQYIPGINGKLLIATELNLRGEKKATINDKRQELLIRCKNRVKKNAWLDPWLFAKKHCVG